MVIKTYSYHTEGNPTSHVEVLRCQNALTGTCLNETSFMWAIDLLTIPSLLLSPREIIKFMFIIRHIKYTPPLGFIYGMVWRKEWGGGNVITIL